MTLSRLYLLIVSIAMAIDSTAQQSIKYIANEGILIEFKESKVLIDAIFDNYYETYLAPTEQVIRSMNAKESPYETIDLLLVTHAHLDHFNPKLVTAFLESHPETKLFCPIQAKDSLMRFLISYDQIQSRITGIKPTLTWQSHSIRNLEIHTTYVRHGGKQNYDVDNQIYLIKANGKKILHLGDAEMDPAHYQRLMLPDSTPDIALIPYWFLAFPPGIDIVKKQIRPNQIVAIHYPKVGDPKTLKKIRDNFPNAVIFMKEGDEVAF